MPGTPYERAATAQRKRTAPILSPTSPARTGRADAAVTDLPITLWFAKQNPDLRALDSLIGPPTNDAIFLKHGDFKLWHVLDLMVAEMQGGILYQDYSDIYMKWFGVTPKHAKYYMAR